MSSRPVKPPPRPLKKAEVVRNRMRAQSTLARIAKARLPPQHVLVRELSAIVPQLEPEKQIACVFLLYERGGHVFVPLNRERELAQQPVALRSVFELSPTLTPPALSAIVADIERAHAKQLRDGANAVSRTRLPPPMQKR